MHGALQNLSLLEGGRGICGPISREAARAMQCENAFFKDQGGTVSTCIPSRLTSQYLEKENLDIEFYCGTEPVGLFPPFVVTIFGVIVMLTLALRLWCCISGFFWLFMMGFFIANLVTISFLNDLRSEKGYTSGYAESDRQETSIACQGTIHPFVKVIHLQWIDGPDAAMASFDNWLTVLVWTTLGSMICTMLYICWLLIVRKKWMGLSLEERSSKCWICFPCGCPCKRRRVNEAPEVEESEQVEPSNQPSNEPSYSA